MAPVGVNQNERPAGVVWRQGWGIGSEQEMARQVGLPAQGIAEELQTGGSAKRLNSALGTVFAVPKNDNDRNGHAGKGRR